LTETKEKYLSSGRGGLIAKSRRNLLLTLIWGASICAVLTAFAPITNDREVYTNVLAVSASGAAFLISLQVILRQKFKGLFPRLYVALGIALGLWFAAESIWAYYELIAGIDTPFPSLADAFWLAGYVPFSYFLVGIIKDFIGVSKSITFPLVAASAVGFAMTFYLLSGIYQDADMSTNDGAFSFAIAAAYPIADMFLVVPAVAAFIQLRKGKLTFTPWFFIVIALLLFIVGDFGFAASTSISEMSDTIWIWDPLYNAGDIAIASALFWHKSYFTVDQKKLLKNWQEQNR
jgi:hypothetical protein